MGTIFVKLNKHISSGTLSALTTQDNIVSPGAVPRV